MVAEGHLGRSRRGITPTQRQSNIIMSNGTHFTYDSNGLLVVYGTQKDNRV